MIIIQVLNSTRFEPAYRDFSVIMCQQIVGSQKGSVKRKRIKIWSKLLVIEQIEPNQTVRVDDALCLQQGAAPETWPDSRHISLEGDAVEGSCASLSSRWPNAVRFWIKNKNEWINKKLLLQCPRGRRHPLLTRLGFQLQWKTLLLSLRLNCLLGVMAALRSLPDKTHRGETSSTSLFKYWLSCQ